MPQLRLRERGAALLELPWGLPLDAWPAAELEFRDLPVGPSRHLVRFLVADGLTFALKEEPLAIANAEFDVLRRLETAGLPAVTAVGLAALPDRDSAILVTEYLAFSIQYRRLLMRFPLGAGPYRDRLLDAMASLLVDLHRAGVYWGDCSLANTLFRRDGDRIQAYLVDAETSEIHPSLSDGQRAYDLDILVENVAFGLADLGAMQGRSDAFDDAVTAAEIVRARYDAVWEELHRETQVALDDRHVIRARIRRLNDLGYAIDEVALDPVSTPANTVTLRIAVANRRFHAHQLQKLTGLVVLEGQARLLLNDMREYQAWLEWSERSSVPAEVATGRWLAEVLEPAISALVPVIGPLRDPVQAYCDVLETKWLLSEAAGRDVGLEAAISAYLDHGAPAPEAGGVAASSMALDIDWSSGFDRDETG